jgi:phosphate:Na+ symporter
MTIVHLLGLVGWIALLVLGMRFLSSSMLRLLGDRAMRLVPVKRSHGRTAFLGVVLGAAAFSANMLGAATIGLVNACVVTVGSATALLMGARLGATLLLVVLALPLGPYAPIIAGGGAVLMLAGNRTRLRHVGHALAGLGIVLVAYAQMGAGLAVLREVPEFTRTCALLVGNPLSGFLIAAAAGLLIRHTAPYIALLMMLVHVGLIPLPAALAGVLGANSSTAALGLLRISGGSLSARRAAMGAFMIPGLLSLVLLPLTLSGLLAAFVQLAVPRDDVALRIAAAHVFFNLLALVVGLPLAGLAERLTGPMIPESREKAASEAHFLDPNLTIMPPLALQLVRRECVRMLGIAQQSFNDALQALIQRQERLFELVHASEVRLGELQDACTGYLVEVMRQNISFEDAESLPVLIHSVNDVERVGDLIERIITSAETLIADRLEFSTAAVDDLAETRESVERMFELTFQALRDDSPDSARRAVSMLEEVRSNCADARQGHLARLRAGTCNPMAGLVFMEVVAALHHIARRLANLDRAVMCRYRWGRGIDLTEDEGEGE